MPDLLRLNGGHPWHGHVFALICPDALARRLAGAIVERVERAGFELVGCRLARVLPDHLDATLGAGRAPGDIYRYRLLDRVFTFGPSLAVVFRDTRDRADPHTDLRRLKGPTDPGTAPPGTIRADLGGVNALLNLVHTSDSVEDSVWEATTMVPGGGFSADRAPVGDPVAGTDAASGRALLRLLDTGPAETRDFDAVLAGHRARVAAACFADLSAAARHEAAEAGANALLAVPGGGASIAAGLAGGPRHPAYDLLRADWRPGLPSLPAEDLAARLAALALPPDPWEELVLLTSARFTPHSHHAEDHNPRPSGPPGIRPARSPTPRRA